MVAYNASNMNVQNTPAKELLRAWRHPERQADISAQDLMSAFNSVGARATVATDKSYMNIEYNDHSARVNIRVCDGVEIAGRARGLPMYNLLNSILRSP